MAGSGGLTPFALRDLVLRQVPPGPSIVALSGGADSVFLAWAVAERPPVRAVTVDHRLPASASLVEAAVKAAAHLGLEHAVIPAGPASPTESDLRRVRLEALEIDAASDEWILTGHTGDDQAETVLGNLLRGAGSAGLAGVPVRRGRFVRPMLALGRAEVRAAVEALGLPFVDDPMNLDMGIRRNRLRLETIPMLEEAYNRRLRQALMRTGALLAADDALIDARAAAVPLRRDEEAVLIPASALSLLPGPIASRVVRRALRLLAGPHGGVARAVETVLAVAAGDPGGEVPGGLSVRREGPFVALAGPPPDPPGPVSLPVPGVARFGPWTVETGSGGVAVPVSGPITIRASRPGDRVAIVGGHKSVVEALREAGVPPRLRSRWPVVEESGRIAWVVGVRVSSDGGRRVMMRAKKERG